MKSITVVVLLAVLLGTSCISLRSGSSKRKVDPLFFERIPARIEMLQAGMNLEDIERAMFLPHPLEFVSRFYSVTIYRSSLDKYAEYKGCSLTVEQNNHDGSITVMYEDPKEKGRITRKLGKPKKWKKIPL